MKKINQINARTSLALLHDIVVAIFAWDFAYLLRFNFSIPSDFLYSIYITSIWVALLQGSVFVVFGLYRGVWRFASVSDLKRILFAVSSAAVFCGGCALYVKFCSGSASLSIDFRSYTAHFDDGR